jgi:hypothetical protein
MDHEIYILTDGVERRITTAIARDGFEIVYYEDHATLFATFLRSGPESESAPPMLGDEILVREVSTSTILVSSRRVFQGVIEEIAITSDKWLMRYRCRARGPNYVAAAQAAAASSIVSNSTQVFWSAMADGTHPPLAAARRPTIVVVEETGRRKITREELPE